MTDRPVQGLSDAHVLVIDDELMNRRLLARFLEKCECHRVVTASSGREGLKLSVEDPPDIVLLDLLMPGLSGHEVLAQMRSSSAPTRDVPIIVLTADITDEARHRALKVGATDFLTKPLDLFEVGLRMANLLETQRLHRIVNDDNQSLRNELADQWEDRFRERNILISKQVSAQEDERRRLARELHDGTIQALCAIAIQLESASELPGADAGRLHMLATHTRRTAEEVRRLIFDLRSPVLDETGLEAALQDLVADCADIGARIDIRGVGKVPTDLATDIYRICQASLSNARIHSACSSVLVTLDIGPEEVTMTITDNGRGFEPRRVSDLVQEGHLGLAIAGERAERLGGRFTITSAPDKGTSVAVSLPTSSGPTSTPPEERSP